MAVCSEEGDCDADSEFAFLLKCCVVEPGMQGAASGQDRRGRGSWMEHECIGFLLAGCCRSRANVADSHAAIADREGVIRSETGTRQARHRASAPERLPGLPCKN